MPILFEDAIKKDISSGNLAPGYILFGDDAYLKKLYADKLADKTAGLDSVFDFQKFSGDCDLQEVYDAVLQFPMMTDRRCVLLTDLDFEKAGKNELDRLCGLLGDLNDTCVFILRFDSVEFDSKRSSKAKKLITAIEKSGGKAIRLDHRKPAELAKMLTDGAGKRGCKMDSLVAKYLIENAGNDINILKNELEKLCHFVGTGTIDRATVDKVCIKTTEASVYDLTSKILACDPSGALKLLDELFFMRLEPMIILYTVSGAYLDMYRVSAARKKGASTNEISAAFGYRGREFVLDRAAGNLRKLDGKKLKLSFDALLEADRALKSFGGDDRTILEELIVRLCFIIAKGKAA